VHVTAGTIKHVQVGCTWNYFSSQITTTSIPALRFFYRLDAVSVTVLNQQYYSTEGRAMSKVMKCCNCFFLAPEMISS